VKTKLGKALRMAHQQLQNHQVVSQVLLFMAPLQVGRGAGGGWHSCVVLDSPVPSFSPAAAPLDQS
jgi:hypothetical protein